MPMRSSTQPTLSQFTWKRIRGAVTLIKARRSTRFTSRSRSKRKNWTKFSKPTASLMTAQSRMLFTMPRQLSICLHRIPTQTTHRTAALQNHLRSGRINRKIPGKYVNFRGSFWMEIFLQFYSAVIIIKTSSAINSFFAENARSGGWRSKNKKGA